MNKVLAWLGGAIATPILISVISPKVEPWLNHWIDRSLQQTDLPESPAISGVESCAGITGACATPDEILSEYKRNPERASQAFETRDVVIVGQTWDLDQCYGTDELSEAQATPCIKFEAGWWMDRSWLACHLLYEEDIQMLSQREHTGVKIMLEGYGVGFEPQNKVARFVDCRIPSHLID